MSDETAQGGAPQRFWFGVVTLFPEMVQSACEFGIFGRAVHSGLLQVATFNPRDHATDRHGTVDDKPYGGGAGMVMMAPPLLAAIAQARDAALAAGCRRCPVVLLSPAGDRFDHRMAAASAAEDGVILVCGRYEGVDQRVIDQAIDREVSLGDFVVSGGELPALVMMDAIARLRDGTVGNAESLNFESHLDGWLEYPQYTRPEIVAGQPVPSVLLSGDHQRVAGWRREQAFLSTYRRRPDLLVSNGVPVERKARERLLALTDVSEQK
ncbi:MAG: tRNA (guanosine(37)-N1)-methyltransferase TrmD [Pseudomonadales bacterium]|nr:tRNA (guanosine(37)-N1)-methyltransferase TrmD [Pseudomonadales bacterium]MCP5182779.1 tRNA (guanosine(37)-N1)-methyltransferase TrmD [Pseudomonadales bacterium]